MNTQFKVKFLNNLAKNKGKEGFTLIELLVVVIIIGVLAAIALPNLLNQVAKGRQAEAKTQLGSLNRTQQAYRLEKATFANALTPLPIQMDSLQYYQAPTFTATAPTLGASHAMVPKDTFTNDIKSYASAVGQQNNGTFSAIVCEQISNPSATTNAAATPGTGTSAAICGADGEAVN